MQHIFKYLLLIIVFGFYSGRCPGNNLSVLIDLHVENVTYDSVFIEIEKKAGVYFSYFSEMLPDTLVTINIKNIKIQQLLNILFYGEKIGYSIYANQVILFEKDEIPLNIKIKGQILKQKDMEIIPYATVEIKGKYKGTITNRNGLFEMVINKKYYKDSILFTSMGYESRVYPVSHFMNESFYKIYLKEKIFEIDAVDIYPDIIERIKLGNYGGIPKGSLYLDTHGQQIATYIKNKKGKEGILAGVGYYISKKGNTEAPLRIHVYSVDTITGKPFEEQIPQMVVIKPQSRKGWMYVNLLAFEIKIPSEGLFVGIEGVFPDDYNEFFNETSFNDDFSDETNSTNKHILDKISYGQRIGYNNRGKNETWHYSITQTWFKIDKKHFNVMIGADVVYRKQR